jgi:hypothetical protein
MDDVISILVPTYPGGGVVHGHNITRIVVNGFDIDMRSLRKFTLTSYVSELTDIVLVYNPIRDLSYRTFKDYMGYTVLIKAPSGPPKSVFVNGNKIAGKNGAVGFVFQLQPCATPYYTVLYNEFTRKYRITDPEYLDENLAGDW